MVTTGGIHGVYAVCQGLLEPGDEVLVPDPEWPPAQGNIACAHAVPVPYPLHESRGWRPDVEEMRRLVTPKTRAIYVNSPNNPTGGVLTRADLEAIAALADRARLWVISDEAYEDVLFDGREHVSIASLPGMYARTIPIYTFSKTYAMTGLRLGYVAVAGRDDPRARAQDALLHRLEHVVADAIRRRRRARGIAGGRRRIPAASWRRGAICSTRASRRRRTASSPAPAGRRVLRVHEDRSGVDVAAAGRARLAVVGDDGVPDQARPHRLRARRGFRRRTAKATCASASRATAQELAGALESMKAALRSSRSRIASCQCRVPAAVDADRLARDEVRVDEREHGLRDLVGAAPAAERRRLLDRRVFLRRSCPAARGSGPARSR